jgi:hypothetical protein
MAQKSRFEADHDAVARVIVAHAVMWSLISVPRDLAAAARQRDAAVAALTPAQAQRLRQVAPAFAKSLTELAQDRLAAA